MMWGGATYRATYTCRYCGGTNTIYSPTDTFAHTCDVWWSTPVRNFPDMGEALLRYMAEWIAKAGWWPAPPVRRLATDQVRQAPTVRRCNAASAAQRRRQTRRMFLQRLKVAA